VSAERWIVETDDGLFAVVVRTSEENTLARREDGRGRNVVMHPLDGARLAVTRLASLHGWAVRRILSPAEQPASP
jgi:hypothetical protein